MKNLHNAGSKTMTDYGDHAINNLLKKNVYMKFVNHPNRVKLQFSKEVGNLKKKGFKLVIRNIT